MHRFVLALAGLLVGCHPAASAKPPARATPVVPPSSAARVAPKLTMAKALPQATSAAPPPAASPEPAVAPPPTFILRYACDDKYDEKEATCRPGKAAWNAWLENVELSATAANLLERRGGGPGGAEWNPAAPLVAFVASSEPGRARLKSSRTTFTPVARFANYDVFLVPVAGWNAAARPARAADFPEGTAPTPISVVELRAVAAQGEQRGLFAFSGGE